MFRRAVALPLFAAALLLDAPAVRAQIQIRPTDSPPVTAANESWYVLREPILFSGDLYYPAGAAVFFDGNTMVPSGHFNGIPIYMDTTIEPYSVVLVPVRRGLMQPYERIRQGDLAGTTGSRTPSFPVTATSANVSVSYVASSAPTQLPRPVGAISAYTPATPARPATVRETSIGTSGSQATEMIAPRMRADDRSIASLRTPDGNVGLWVPYAGQKWVSAGAAVPLRSTEFRAIGQYAGFPVFIRDSQKGTIYIPTRAGLVAPYKKLGI